MTLSAQIDTVERRLEQLPASLVLGYWIRGVKGEPGFWSPRVFELYGMPASDQPPPADVVLQNLDMDTRARTWTMIDRCAQGLAPFELDYSVQTSRGGARRLKSTGDRVRSSDGKIVLMGVVQDIGLLETLRAEVHTLARRLRSAGAVERKDRLSTRQWQRVESLIRNGNAQPLATCELAAHVQLSAAEFSRRFKGTTGETPQQYMLRYRLECASEALRRPHLSVGQVAHDYGFFDQAHFTRHFKRQFGLTPGRFARISGE
jgi:AraC-like DNA-binding protein